MRFRTREDDVSKVNDFILDSSARKRGFILVCYLMVSVPLVFADLAEPHGVEVGTNSEGARFNVKKNIPESSAFREEQEL